jgi:hypothetical protein
MKYNERYDLVMFRDGILIYDTHLDQPVNPLTPLEYASFAAKEIEVYEDNLVEAALYRSTQDGYVKGEFQEQQAKNQKLK